jgi:hypothetical protein
MSALLPKADIGTQPRNIRFVSKADIRDHDAGLMYAEDNGWLEVTATTRDMLTLTAALALRKYEEKGSWRSLTSCDRRTHHASAALARHRRSVWRTGHTAWSKLPPRHLVLGQPLFIG